MRTLSARIEFAVVVIGAFGYFILGNILALLDPTPGPPISDTGLRSLVVYEAVVLTALLAFLRFRNWPLQRLSMLPTPQGTLVGLGLAAAAYVAYAFALLIAAGVSSQIAEQAASTTIVAPGLGLGVIVAVSIVNPIFEEVFVCGYVVSSLKEDRGFWTAVNVSIAIRLAYHLYQGQIGVLSIVPAGFIFAYWYARTGRLWPVIAAHGIFDFLGLFLGSGR